jgi:hypothetical protein
MKQFTFQAPSEYLGDTTSNLKTITGNYTGSPTIWISVDKQTHKVITFSGEGTLPKPADTDTIEYIKLDQENPNQVILMDMLYTCNGHDHGPVINETIHTFSDLGYSIVYPRWTNEDTQHTYQLSDVTVSDQGVVTYPWKVPHITLDQIKEAVNIRISVYNQEYEKATLASRRSRYEKALEILRWIKNNILDGSVKPWKINLPDAEEL